MKKYLLLLSATTMSLLATMQMCHDSMIINGQKRQIYAAPLERYLHQTQSKAIKSAGVCSGCWNGYEATWDIIDDYLILLKVDEYACSSDDGKAIPLHKIFPKHKGKSIKATWYSGVVQVALGEVIEYKEMGSIYAEDIFFTFEKGKLIKTKRVSNRKKPKKDPLESFR